MIYPHCPRCGQRMIVRMARRGFNAGGEFWGCEGHFTNGCDGTREVPWHEWDWFGLVPVPVSIIGNQQRWFDESVRNSEMEERLREYDSLHGVWGPYEDYDELMWNMEHAMETADWQAELLREELQRESPDYRNKVEMLIDGRSNGYSMAQGVVKAAGMIWNDLAFHAFCTRLTARVDGSGIVRIDDQDKGIVIMDDRSLVLFGRQDSEVLMSSCKGYPWLFEDNCGPSAKIPMHRFEGIARFFSKNFGLHAPSVEFH